MYYEYVGKFLVLNWLVLFGEDGWVLEEFKLRWVVNIRLYWECKYVYGYLWWIINYCNVLLVVNLGEIRNLELVWD